MSSILQLTITAGTDQFKADGDTEVVERLYQDWKATVDKWTERAEHALGRELSASSSDRAQAVLAEAGLTTRRLS